MNYPRNIPLAPTYEPGRRLRPWAPRRTGFGLRLGLRPWLRLWSTVLLLASFSAPPVGAETNESLPWSYESTGVETSGEIWLATDVFLPPKVPETGLPTVLIRTPYGRYQFRDGELMVGAFVEAGYAVVTQDVRGKWGSTGEFMPFVNEQEDGVATLDWIVDQAWSNGKVGIWGSSYLGYCGLVLLPTRHEALVTVFNLSGWLDGERVSQPGGATHLMLVLPWLLQEETERKRPRKAVDLETMFHHLPLIDAFEAIGIDSPAWRDPSIIQPPAHDFAVAPPTASVFHLTGWYDFVAGGLLDVYRELDATGARQSLRIGPWFHNQVFTEESQVGEEEFGPAAVAGVETLERLAIDWFDRELRGGREPKSTSVEIFVMGKNRWESFESWPPARSRTQRWHLALDAESAPGLVAVADSKRPWNSVKVELPADPLDPVPTWGGANFHAFGDVSGVLDQRRIESRDDVVVFTSPAAVAPLTLAGPARATIHLSSTGRDADLVAKLTIVRADGSSAPILEGILRASFDRTGPLEAGERVELTVDLGDTAVVIEPGERLRLQLAGSSFPKYDRNPHTGEDAREAKTLVKVVHTIHSTPELPSFVELSVLPEPSTPKESPDASKN